MVGRDVFVGIDPGVALMIAAGLIVAVIGGMYAVFFALVRWLGWLA